MSVETPCPECGDLVEVPNRLAGKMAHCSRCEATFTVGAEEAIQTAEEARPLRDSAEQKVADWPRRRREEKNEEDERPRRLASQDEDEEAPRQPVDGKVQFEKAKLGLLLCSGGTAVMAVAMFFLL